MARLYLPQRKYVVAHQFSGDVDAVSKYLDNYYYRCRLVTVEPMADRFTKAPYLHIRDVSGRELRVDVGDWLVYSAYVHSHLTVVGNDEFREVFELADDDDDDADVPGNR